MTNEELVEKIQTGIEVTENIKRSVRYGSRRMNQSAEKSGSLDMKLICLTVSKGF